MVEYEYRVLTFDRRVGRDEVRAALTEAADQGRWELARTRVFLGGRRRTWLRRRIVRVPRASVDAAWG